MNDIAALLHLDAITAHQRARTTAIHAVLAPGQSEQTTPDPLAHALAHHYLEGAEGAARTGDAAAVAWHRAGPQRDWSNLITSTTAGPRVVLAPDEHHLVRTPVSETPYYVIGPSTARAHSALRQLTAAAFDCAASTGLGSLTADHAAVVCLTGQRRPDQIIRNFTITRLPGTVFTDHTGDPLVLGRELVHEAAHNWLNAALAAQRIAFPDTPEFYSPWRRTHRPAFGFLHACFAFPLTVIYATRALPDATGATRTILTDHLHQQRAHLATARHDFPHALNLIRDDQLRCTLHQIFDHAGTL